MRRRAPVKARLELHVTGQHRLHDEHHQAALGKHQGNLVLRQSELLSSSVRAQLWDRPASWRAGAGTERVGLLLCRRGRCNCQAGRQGRVWALMILTGI